MLPYATYSKYEYAIEMYDKKSMNSHALSSREYVRRDKTIIERRVSSVELTDENHGSLWQGLVTVGTPPQTFTVSFDTGRGDLILPGADCEEGCRGLTKYNTTMSNASVDRKQTFAFDNGDGFVRGAVYEDSISLAGLNVST